MLRRDPPSFALPGTRPPPEAHGPATRVVRVLAGALFVLCFGAIACAAGAGLVNATKPRAVLGAALGIVLLVPFVAFGGWLFWTGLRGYSRPGARARRLLFVLAAEIGLLGAVSLAVFLALALRTDPRVALRAWWLSDVGSNWRMAMLVLALPLQLAAHELGHLLAGRLVGLEFASLQLGPWCLDRDTGRWRVSLRPIAFGFGGRATMRFASSDRIGPRLAVFAAGGPAANLLLAIVAALAAAALSGPQSRGAAFAFGLLVGCAAQGLAMAALNLVPIGVAATDGARILRALREPSAVLAAGGGASLDPKPPPYLRVVDRE